MTLRLDQGTLRSPQVMPDGRLRVDGYLTRTGVFAYLTSDGTQRREYRPPSEVFDPKSLASFQMAPVTDDHPPPGKITADNARKHAVGMVGESVRQDGEHVAAPLMIMDAATIRKVRAGKVELSCGYDCDTDETPGHAPSGERYDAIQRNIRGNHVALVDVARAGRTAKLRMDAAVMRIDVPEAGLQRKDWGSMAKKEPAVTIEQAAEQLLAANQRADAAEAEAAKYKVQLDAAVGERDGLKTRLDSAESELKNVPDPNKFRAQIAQLTDKVKRLENKARTDSAEAPERLRAAVRERVEVEAAGAAVLGVGERLDSTETQTIRLAVIAKLTGVSCDSQSSDYIKARFDSAMEGWRRGHDSLLELAAVTQQHGADQEKPSAVAARAKMEERHKNAWKTGSQAQAGK